MLRGEAGGRCVARAVVGVGRIGRNGLVFLACARVLVARSTKMRLCLHRLSHVYDDVVAAKRAACVSMDHHFSPALTLDFR